METFAVRPTSRVVAVQIRLSESSLSIDSELPMVVVRRSECAMSRFRC